MSQLRKLSTFVMLVAALGLVSCGSGSKKNKNGSVVQTAADLSKASLDDVSLNADSDSGKAGALRTVFFPFNSASLTGSTKTTLDTNAEFLKMFPSVEVQIEGHCDERGGVQYNIALGEKRARAVRNYLIAKGVNRNRISTISFGKERPISFGHEESSWGQNRRGNFVVTAK